MIGSNDEDWSIISSSSELDDERATSSSVGSSYEPMANADSSIGTLRLPNLDPSAAAEAPALVSGQPNTLDTSDATIDAAAAVVQHCVAEKERPIDTIINFYESLSANTKALHKSLKQKSDSLYHQVAKPQLETFNQYLENSGMEADSAHKSSHKPHIYASVMHRLRSPVKCASNWMEAHSEYLLHFFALALVALVGLWAVATRSAAPPKTMTFYEKAYQKADCFLFEEEIVASKYFGLVKARTRKLRHADWFRHRFHRAARAVHAKSFHVRRYLNDVDAAGWLFLTKNSARHFWRHSKATAAQVTDQGAAALRMTYAKLEKSGWYVGLKKFNASWLNSDDVSIYLDHVSRFTHHTWNKALVHGRRYAGDARGLSKAAHTLVLQSAAVCRPWVQHGAGIVRESTVGLQARSGESLRAFKRTVDTASVWVYQRYLLLSSS